VRRGATVTGRTMANGTPAAAGPTVAVATADLAVKAVRGGTACEREPVPARTAVHRHGGPMTIDQESTVVSRREPGSTGGGDARQPLTDVVRTRDGRRQRTRGVTQRVVILVAAVAGLALLPIPPALADPPDVNTVIRRDVTLSFASADPCTGAAGTSTITFDVVGHVTFHGVEDGLAVFHSNQTQVGTFTFVPDDPSLPSYSGRFVTTISAQATPPGRGFVLTITSRQIAKTEDGMFRWQFKLHVTMLPSGEIVVQSLETACRSA
jgi:hypothetical protein